MKKTSVWCKIMAALAYFIAVAYCFTLILIPVAIYCFIGARKYVIWSDMEESQVVMQKQSVLNWAIFFSIVGFPIGLLSIIPAYIVNNNNVTITNVSEKTESENVVSDAKEESYESVSQIEDTAKQNSEASNAEILEKLDKLKAEGLITEEEYNRAKSEIE